jgi:hypothetical protein
MIIDFFGIRESYYSIFGYQSVPVFSSLIILRDAVIHYVNCIVCKHFTFKAEWQSGEVVYTDNACESCKDPRCGSEGGLMVPRCEVHHAKNVRFRMGPANSLVWYNH